MHYPCVVHQSQPGTSVAQFSWPWFIHQQMRIFCLVPVLDFLIRCETVVGEDGMFEILLNCLLYFSMSWLPSCLVVHWFLSAMLFGALFFLAHIWKSFGFNYCILSTGDIQQFLPHSWPAVACICGFCHNCWHIYCISICKGNGAVDSVKLIFQLFVQTLMFSILKRSSPSLQGLS